MRSGKFQASVASYIEFYNTKRPHCTLKNLTPCQAEENFNKNAKWDSGVRIAWLLCFLLQFEVVWAFSSQIFHGVSIPQNAVMSRLSEYKTAPPNSQVSSTCSNWVGSFILELLTRFELVTSSLPRMRSTDWATAANLATRNGLEPSTSSVTG